MSHVDEGELTAYADGAYAPGAADAQRIEAHLAVCENCRNRLAQAQALAGRAREILAFASPTVAPMPSFAELSDRSVQPARERKRMPLAWAATVILAVGLGWFGRGELQQQQTEIASDDARVGDTAPLPTPAAPAVTKQTGPRTDSRPGPPTDAVARERKQLPEPARLAGAASGAGQVATGEMPPLNPPSAPPPSAAGNAVASLSRADVANQPAESDISYMTAAEAERRGVPLHIVPELEVLRVGVRGGDTVVEQKLPDGKILTVTTLADVTAQRQEDARDFAAESKARAAAAPMMVRAAGLMITRAGKRVNVMAGVPADSLRALAAKVR